MRQRGGRKRSKRIERVKLVIFQKLGRRINPILIKILFGGNQNFLSRWGPALVWMSLIFYGSSRQRVQLAENFWLNFLFFKTLHLVEYGILFLLNYRGWSNKRRAFWWTLFFAVSDEIHQTFVPTREGHPRDVLIDGLGAFFAWLLTKVAGI